MVKKIYGFVSVALFLICIVVLSIVDKTNNIKLSLTIQILIIMILYPLVIFNDKKIKVAGIIIGIILLTLFAFITLYKPNTYETEILTNGGSAGAVFDDSYKVYIADESFGKVDIRFIEQGLNDWVVHAIFNKKGNTEVILESPSGEKTVFDIKIDRKTYTIEKK